MIIRCLLSHDWVTHQEIFVTHSGFDDEYKVVIAWKICTRCAASKLIHILK